MQSKDFITVKVKEKNTIIYISKSAMSKINKEYRNYCIVELKLTSNVIYVILKFVSEKEAEKYKKYARRIIKNIISCSVMSNYFSKGKHVSYNVKFKDNTIIAEFKEVKK